MFVSNIFSKVPVHDFSDERQLHLDGVLCLLVRTIHQIEVASRTQLVIHCKPSDVSLMIYNQ